MSIVSERVRWFPGWVRDAGFGLVIVAAAVASAHELGVTRTPLLWLIELIPAALMLVRRRLPWLVLAAAVVSYGIVAVAGTLTPVTALAVAFAIYSLAMQRSRTTVLIAAAVTVVVMEVVTISVVGRFIHDSTTQVIETVGLALAIGLFVRTRRDYVDAIRERAERAEATRETEAARRVIEDRLRIAQDLHDTVAHQISVISLNAGVATATLDHKPDAAREALASIRAASRNVLSEIGSLLSALRLPDETAPTTPTVGLDQLEDLIAGFENTGLSVERQQAGNLGVLTPAVSAVAYRVIQEGLTNAHKHGTGHTARLDLDVTDTALHIQVSRVK
ncbi:sensor histidine kinase [Leucobacter weissii]|uniref:histidine kinase n=1 Tax=Leucobacter weissii TaxID=1983706 RepID=A0A939S9L2_9MICO|nr:histidine kinase [Leucobacter weissii]MBO1903281.1 sensor histidine kinase [Leucobacter weissii]